MKLFITTAVRTSNSASMSDVRDSFHLLTFQIAFNESECRKRKVSDDNNNAYRFLMGKPEGKRPLGRPKRRWVDNIRIDLAEVGWVDVDWIGLAQDKGTFVNSVLNLRVP
jgi:hypothetical protein